MGTYKPLRLGIEEFLELSGRSRKHDGIYEMSRRPASQTEDVGGVSYEEALEMARHGWREGRESVSRLSSDITHKIGHAIKVPSLSYDVVGDTPDVGAFIAGVPEHMMSIEDGPGAGRIVKLVVAIGASGGISAKEITARGSVAVALVDALESAGIRCEIVAAKCTRMLHNTKWQGYITLKRPEEPLNIDRVAFALAHAAFFRRLIWNAYEITPDEVGIKVDRAGYGHTDDVPQSEHGDIYMPAITYSDGWKNIDADGMRDRALALLKEAGVELEEGA